jgi:hypothetical protein
MNTLKKTQMLRLVTALSKLSLKQLDKALTASGFYEADCDEVVTKPRFIGFTNESFETAITAVYELKVSHRKLVSYLYVGWWRGAYVATWVRSDLERLRERSDRRRTERSDWR